MENTIEEKLSKIRKLERVLEILQLKELNELEEFYAKLHAKNMKELQLISENGAHKDPYAPQKRYYEKNKEKEGARNREYTRKHYKQNPQYYKEYYEKNKDKIIARNTKSAALRKQKKKEQIEIVQKEIEQEKSENLPENLPEKLENSLEKSEILIQ